MLIQPNSTISILKNVPLDNTYNHTLWFDNVSAQTAYFTSMAKYTMSGQSYQRVNRGVGRIQKKADDIYDCNYMMFQNTSYGNKWFYAFITAIEYVNDVTCEITFEIDPIQTYLFDIELKMCFVEREHSSTDVAGDNVIDEPVNTGDITISGIDTLYQPQSYCAVVGHTAFETGAVTKTGGVYSGLFSGVDYDRFDLSEPTAIENFKALLQDFSDNQKNDSIVSIFMMPSDMYQTKGQSEPKEIPVAPKAKPTSISGYTPRNKKLLTFPYNYMVVDSGKDSGIYRYEWFKNSNNVEWSVHGITCCNPQIMVVPKNYCDVEFNYPEALTIEGFPQIAYTIDSYRAYLAQSSVGSTLRGLENAFSGQSQVGLPRMGGLGANGLTGGAQFALNGAKSLFGSATDLFKAIKGVMTGDVGGALGAFIRGAESNKHPNKASGTPTAEISVALKVKGVYVKQMCVQRNYAEVIDNFFDMFGYATNRVKIPNRTVRPHWNYVKTNGCDVVGNAPADDIRAVCNIYDKGITFWKNPSEVGDYSLNNSL